VFTRIDGMDRALRLANEKIAEKPTDAERIIENLRVLTDERGDRRLLSWS